MQKHHVRTPDQALSYIIDCTLATVADLASRKSRKKSEFKRQIAIAQQGIDWMKAMGVEMSTTRAEKITQDGVTVEQWAEQFMPETREASV